LADLPAADLLRVGQAVIAEEPQYGLGEVIAKIDELVGPAVTPLTRRRLISSFEGYPLVTEIEDLELIRGLWPISTMPAPMHGAGYTLEDDIVRHTIRNDDLTQRELLELLGLMTCSRAQLFRFLAALAEPDVQAPDRQAELVAMINGHLVHDGYVLAEIGRVSGSPQYGVRLAPSRSPADASISEVLSAFDPQDVGPRWDAAMRSRQSDPARAITLARTLLEDVCKWVLTEAGVAFNDGDDLPVLYKQLSKALKLAPDDHTEQVFKQILGSCASVVESLGALRNKLGDAHSIGPIRARPRPRHAELAVNLSGAMATFLVSTWQVRKVESERAAQLSPKTSPLDGRRDGRPIE
jgi:hypothetical protein